MVREIAEEINAGFGQRIFPMVASSNHCKGLLFCFFLHSVCIFVCVCVCMCVGGRRMSNPCPLTPLPHPPTTNKKIVSLLFMMDNNLKLYEKALEEEPSVGQRWVRTYLLTFTCMRW